MEEELHESQWRAIGDFWKKSMNSLSSSCLSSNFFEVDPFRFFSDLAGVVLSSEAVTLEPIASKRVLSSFDGNIVRFQSNAVQVGTVLVSRNETIKTVIEYYTYFHYFQYYS